MKLGRRRLQLGEGLRLGQRGLELRDGGLELSLGLRGWRLELGASSRGCRVLSALFRPGRAPQARQQLGERVHVNRATGHLRAGNGEQSRNK